MGVKICILFASTIVLSAVVVALPLPEEEESRPSKAIASSSSEEIKDLDNLSPKLLSFLERLLAIDPKLIDTGERRLEYRQLLGVNQFDEILGEATSEERDQFFDALEGVEKLYEKHPIAKELIENLLNSKKGQSMDAATFSSSEEFYDFINEFSNADKELSQFPAWNKYWNIWFKKHVDYMTKYGK